MNLKIVRGHTPNERMMSIDGILNSIDRKLRRKPPDEKLRAEVAVLRQRLNTLMDFLGLKEESGPKRTLRRTRIVEEIENALGTDHTL